LPEFDPRAENNESIAKVGFSAVFAALSSTFFIITSLLALILFWVEYATRSNTSSASITSPSPRARSRSYSEPAEYQDVAESHGSGLFRKSVYEDAQYYGDENEAPEDGISNKSSEKEERRSPKTSIKSLSPRPSTSKDLNGIDSEKKKEK